MPHNIYPEHDINQVFDWIHRTLSSGNVADNALDEMSFLNRLFAALPVEAVEYGMQFLHGKRDLPKACDEILPLYIRFVNLVDYCEVVEALKEIPKNPTPEELNVRIKMHGKLDEMEECFCKSLLGFAFNKDASSGKSEPEPVPEDSDSAESTDDKDESGNLHLMNSIAPVFVCEDPMKTALFYETKLGFHASHLDDESMPHIRLKRDNIEIILVKKEEDETVSRSSSHYDLYIFVSEPMMLQLELQGAGVEFLKLLEESDTVHTNREFIFKDVDGRRICVSQRDT
ncbi:MAG: hypothetical protein K6E26_10525 [Clostridiales bacterium]|nr:hypothetical protein [Clostridiales bacterium]